MNITTAILQAKIAHYNSLTGQDLNLFRYQRAAYPYALRLNSQTVLRGSKSDIYLYLDGAITGINTYKASNNLR